MGGVLPCLVLLPPLGSLPDIRASLPEPLSPTGDPDWCGPDELSIPSRREPPAGVESCSAPVAIQQLHSGRGTPPGCLQHPASVEETVRWSAPSGPAPSHRAR